ncbi:Basic leucine zipper transcriptional factor ATF-like [Merluccius polli]|uniref:Basic leucine zipper transcriptional factor ATF-like n=1 Tax=Merluccius polli TaxID=89951 RepID=A0AA47MZK0_MERPO|nr:Basic leucine zipper transcriptional factor ATF-like [Merluccius polli]
MRREKNRIAAQKSRMRQTQKADTLHLVSTPSSDPGHMGRPGIEPRAFYGGGGGHITVTAAAAVPYRQIVFPLLPLLRPLKLGSVFRHPCGAQGALWPAGSVIFTRRHLTESEDLEKKNVALRKEVKQLTEEKKYLSSVLSSHEPQCTRGLTPQTEPLFSAAAAAAAAAAAVASHGSGYPLHPHPHLHHHHQQQQHQQQHLAAGPHYHH